MFNKKQTEKRFEVLAEQTVNMVGITVIRDVETGVNYIMGQGPTGFGITPLLDRDGKVVVTTKEKLDDFSIL